MTENDGGAPRDPQRDPETPPTQPLPGSDAGPAPSEPTEPVRPAFAEHGVPAEPYGQPAASAADEPVAAGANPPPAAPQYGYAPTPPKNDLGVWALVTGILSYVFCPLLLGVAAIITGTMSRRAADEGLANNRGMGTAGLILGWINVALSLLAIAFFVVALAAGLLAGGLGEWGDMNDMNRYGGDYDY
ncbi:DUF4190 domain-containing protein [Promicromonospora thailandica]|uniref:DUF4190 domain-containing protein n=1 Tax=Promicromonospora thailandica TaxID=765201 RepID=A0A9X2GDQ2_9MICO|nr:DUF4190 domain-containing protein [Promicromonospora thailandica]MCP2266721.1 protein of unknown function (DUF4190) [Promicromonospora thailandica]